MGFSVMLWGAEKLVPAEYWCPYGTTHTQLHAYGNERINPQSTKPEIEIINQLIEIEMLIISLKFIYFTWLMNSFFYKLVNPIITIGM